jgi:ribosomal protein S18 acetylase RimI-like enzyme
MDFEYKIRPMTESDYEGVHALWMTIHGFGIRSIDDSKEGVVRFLNRNPNISAVAESDGKIVGSILCGHDGRRACFYHVCVSEKYRMHGIGRKMVAFCCEQLKKEHINKVCLNAFVTNTVGNKFWQKMGWTLRDDMNYYDFTLNPENLTIFNK